MKFKLLMLSTALVALLSNVPSYSMEEDQRDRSTTRRTASSPQDNQNNGLTFWGRLVSWFTKDTAPANSSSAPRSTTVHVDAQTNPDQLSAMLRPTVHREPTEDELRLKREREEFEREQDRLRKEREAFEHEKELERRRRHEAEEKRLQEERDRIEKEKLALAAKQREFDEQQRLREEEALERKAREEEERHERLKQEELRLQEERLQLARKREDMDCNNPTSSASLPLAEVKEDLSMIPMPAKSLIPRDAEIKKESNHWRMTVPKLATIKVYDGLSEASGSPEVQSLLAHITPFANREKLEAAMKWVNHILKQKGKELHVAEQASVLIENFKFGISELKPENVRIALKGPEKKYNSFYLLITIEGGQVILIKVPGE